MWTGSAMPSAAFHHLGNRTDSTENLSIWNWGDGRMDDDTMDKVHNKRNVHGDGGLYVGGVWLDTSEVAERIKARGDGAHHDRPCERSQSRVCAAKPDGSYDVIIIGAGCIGSAIARELSKTTASVLILEAADDVTQGATKGNSGIVHAGFDDKPGTNRAKYCWPGNQLFPALDRELHFGFERAGSLVIAKTDDDVKALVELMARGKKNGVKNLRIVLREELLLLEPHVDKDAIAALLAPDAGTITPYEYTIALAENAVQNGVELRLRREVVAINKRGAGAGELFSVEARHWETPSVAEKLPAFQAAMDAAGGVAWSPSPGTVMGGPAVREVYRARHIINAGGCVSDKIAAMVGDTSFKVKPRMGEYILLSKAEGPKSRHVLFPAPHPVYGKGVIVQTTLWGNLILGPTARDTLKKDEASGEYVVDQAVRDEKTDDIMAYILMKCRKLVPNFNAGNTIHTFAGVRAKNTTGDWVIGPLAGVPGFINAASIDSPGIAASPAIALDIVTMLQAAGLQTIPDPKFIPYRAPIFRPKDGYKGLKMTPDIEDAWSCKDPRSNVVCKCERVTEAEVVDACRRSLPIDSTQAIRKRTRAGMGHCQGDPDNYCCEQRVAAIIARETGLAYEEVGTRPWPASSMMPKRIFDKADLQHVRELNEDGRSVTLAGAAL